MFKNLLRFEKVTVMHHLSRNFQNMFEFLEGKIHLLQIITNIHTVCKRYRKKPRLRQELCCKGLLYFPTNYGKNIGLLIRPMRSIYSKQYYVMYNYFLIRHSFNDDGFHVFGDNNVCICS